MGGARGGLMYILGRWMVLVGLCLRESDCVVRVRVSGLEQCSSDSVRLYQPAAVGCASKLKTVLLCLSLYRSL